MIVFKGLKPAKILGKRLIVLFGICCLSNGYCDVFRLTVNGCPDAEIVEEKQIQSDIAFFNTALKRCTGTELPVVTQPSPGKKVIKFDIARQPLDREDAFTISFPSRNEMLISGSPNSARWAMNHLLESLGVRFVMSGAHGTHYPKLSSAEVPLVPVKKDAAFKLRRKMHAEDPQWERCLNGKRETGGELFETHNLFRIFPPSKYARKEWRGKIMPVHRGKRIERPADSYAYWQPCFSHPESVSEAVKNIRAVLDKRPQYRTFSLGVNDNGGFCECPECIRMNGGPVKSSRFGRRKNFSGIFFRWANQVVREVRKTHPDIFFGVLAYEELIDPPPFRLDDHIIPVLTTEIYQSREPKMKAKYTELMKAWAQQARWIGFWEYGYGSRYYIAPRVYPELQREMMKLYAQHGGMNFFAEGDSYIGEGPKRYLYYKLSFDPDADVNALLDDWYRACVGPDAAPYLKNYYRIWERYWTGAEVRKTPWYKTVGSTYCNFEDASHIYAVTASEMKSAHENMEKMIASARKSGDPEQQIRAERLYQFFTMYEARQYASGVGCFPVNDRFASDREAAAFLAHVPGMSAAYKKIVPIANAVVEYKKKEKFPGYFGADKFPREMRRTSFFRQINRVIPFLNSDKVQEELRKISANSDVVPEYREFCSGFLRSVTAPNLMASLLDGPNAAKLWNSSHNVRVEKVPSTDGSPRFRMTAGTGWVAPRLTVPMRPNRLYLFTARITPEPGSSFANTRVFMYCSRRNNTIQSGNSGADTIFPVRRDSQRVYAIVKSSANTYCGQVYTILNGIRPGNSAFLDQIELKCLSVPDQLEPLFHNGPIGKMMYVPGEPRTVHDEITILSGKQLISQEMYEVDPSRDRLRVTVSAQGKGSFRVVLQLYLPGNPTPQKVFRSDVMTAVPAWRDQEFETDLKYSAYKSGKMHLQIRIKAEEAPGVTLKNLKVERILRNVRQDGRDHGS